MATNLEEALAPHAASLKSLTNLAVELSHDSDVSLRLSQQLFEVAMNLVDQADALEEMRERLAGRKGQSDANTRNSELKEP